MNPRITPMTPTSIIRFARKGPEVFLMNKVDPNVGFRSSAIAYPSMAALQATWNIIPDWATLARDQHSVYVVARRTA